MRVALTRSAHQGTKDMKGVNNPFRAFFVGIALCRAFCLTSAWLAFTWQSPALAADLERLRGWGLETYNEINRTLRVPGTQLFAETASLGGAQSGGRAGRAFVWPASTQFRVFNTLAQI